MKAYDRLKSIGYLNAEHASSHHLLSFFWVSTVVVAAFNPLKTLHFIDTAQLRSFNPS